MSVLIKGMKMPKKCIECPCSYITEGAYWDSCDAVDFQNDIEKIERDGRPDWCPLVEVPTPHGRLIDADAFESNMQNEWERNEISNSEWIHFREMINTEPTIIETED